MEKQRSRSTPLFVNVNILYPELESDSDIEGAEEIDDCEAIRLLFRGAFNQGFVGEDNVDDRNNEDTDTDSEVDVVTVPLAEEIEKTSKDTERSTAISENTSKLPEYSTQCSKINSEGESSKNILKYKTLKNAVLIASESNNFIHVFLNSDTSSDSTDTASDECGTSVLRSCASSIQGSHPPFGATGSSVVSTPSSPSPSTSACVLDVPSQRSARSSLDGSIKMLNNIPREMEICKNPTISSDALPPSESASLRAASSTEFCNFSDSKSSKDSLNTSAKILSIIESQNQLTLSSNGKNSKSCISISAADAEILKKQSQVALVVIERISKEDASIDHKKSRSTGRKRSFKSTDDVQSGTNYSKIPSPSSTNTLASFDMLSAVCSSSDPPSKKQEPADCSREHLDPSPEATFVRGEQLHSPLPSKSKNSKRVHRKCSSKKASMPQSDKKCSMKKTFPTATVNSSLTEDQPASRLKSSLKACTGSSMIPGTVSNKLGIMERWIVCSGCGNNFAYNSHFNRHKCPKAPLDIRPTPLEFSDTDEETAGCIAKRTRSRTRSRSRQRELASQATSDVNRRTLSDVVLGGKSDRNVGKKRNTRRSSGCSQTSFSDDDDDDDEADRMYRRRSSSRGTYSSKSGCSQVERDGFRKARRTRSRTRRSKPKPKPSCHKLNEHIRKIPYQIREDASIGGKCIDILKGVNGFKGNTKRSTIEPSLNLGRSKDKEICGSGIEVEQSRGKMEKQKSHVFTEHNRSSVEETVENQLGRRTRNKSLPPTKNHSFSSPPNQCKEFRGADNEARVVIKARGRARKQSTNLPVKNSPVGTGKAELSLEGEGIGSPVSGVSAKRRRGRPTKKPRPRSRSKRNELTLLLKAAGATSVDALKPSAKRTRRQSEPPNYAFENKIFQDICVTGSERRTRNSLSSRYDSEFIALESSFGGWSKGNQSNARNVTASSIVDDLESLKEQNVPVKDDTLKRSRSVTSIDVISNGNDKHCAGYMGNQSAPSVASSAKRPRGRPQSHPTSPSDGFRAHKGCKESNKSVTKISNNALRCKRSLTGTHSVAKISERVDQSHSRKMSKRTEGESAAECSLLVYNNGIGNNTHLEKNQSNSLQEHSTDVGKNHSDSILNITLKEASACHADKREGNQRRSRRCKSLPCCNAPSCTSASNLKQRRARSSSRAQLASKAVDVKHCKISNKRLKNKLCSPKSYAVIDLVDDDINAEQDKDQNLKMPFRSRSKSVSRIRVSKSLFAAPILSGLEMIGNVFPDPENTGKQTDDCQTKTCSSKNTGSKDTNGITGCHLEAGRENKACSQQNMQEIVFSGSSPESANIIPWAKSRKLDILSSKSSRKFVHPNILRHSADNTSSAPVDSSSTVCDIDVMRGHVGSKKISVPSPRISDNSQLSELKIVKNGESKQQERRSVIECVKTVNQPVVQGTDVSRRTMELPAIFNPETEKLEDAVVSKKRVDLEPMECIGGHRVKSRLGEELCFKSFVDAKLLASRKPALNEKELALPQAEMVVGGSYDSRPLVGSSSSVNREEIDQSSITGSYDLRPMTDPTELVKNGQQTSKYVVQRVSQKSSSPENETKYHLPKSVRHAADMATSRKPTNLTLATMKQQKPSRSGTENRNLNNNCIGKGVECVDSNCSQGFYDYDKSVSHQKVDECLSSEGGLCEVCGKYFTNHLYLWEHECIVDLSITPCNSSSGKDLPRPVDIECIVDNLLVQHPMPNQNIIYQQPISTNTSKCAPSNQSYMTTEQCNVADDISYRVGVGGTTFKQNYEAVEVDISRVVHSGKRAIPVTKVTQSHISDGGSPVRFASGHIETRNMGMMLGGTSSRPKKWGTLPSQPSIISLTAASNTYRMSSNVDLNVSSSTGNRCIRENENCKQQSFSRCVQKGPCIILKPIWSTDRKETHGIPGNVDQIESLEKNETSSFVPSGLPSLEPGRDSVILPGIQSAQRQPLVPQNQNQFLNVDGHKVLKNDNNTWCGVIQCNKCSQFFLDVLYESHRCVQ